MLTGTLADGETIEFNLNTVAPDSFNAGSTISVALAAAVLLGDVNLDGVVDFLDIQPFIDVLASGGNQFEADINGDGDVDFLDIAPFIAVLAGQ